MIKKIPSPNIICNYFLFLALFFFSSVLTSAEGPTYVSGDITTDTAWTIDGSPYIVTGDISVYKVSGLATLTINPGVEVRFAPGTGLYVGNGTYSHWKGALNAQGKETEPIVFTSETHAPGSWKGIYWGFGTEGNLTVLDYCQIEYAGQGGKALHIENVAQPFPLSHLTISNNSGSGIYVNNSSPLIQNSIIQYSSDGGIRLKGSSSANITGNTIQNNVAGIYVEDSGPSPFVTANNILNNSSYPISLYPTNTTNLGDNTASGNLKDVIELRTGDIGRNTTWPKTSLVYVVTGDISVYEVKANGLATLTINPGVEVRFNAGTGLYVGNGTYSYWKGALNAQGTESEPIIFTSETRAPGSWNGIYFKDGTEGSLTALDNCRIEYAGNGGNALYIYNVAQPFSLSHLIVSNNSGNGVYVNNSSPVIQYSLISNNAVSGINIKDRGNPVIQRNTVENNPVGIYVQDVNSSYIVTIFGNTITNNTTYGVRVYGYNTTYYPQIVVNNNSFLSNGGYEIYATSVSDTSSKRIDAENNWWGTTDVPAIESLIYDNLDNSNFPVVDYDPFLENFAIFISNNNVTQRFFDPRRGETAAIGYAIDQDAEVTLNIYEYPLGTLVRTLIANEPRFMGANVEIWDGKDDGGEALSPGLYTYTIHAEAAGGRRGDYDPSFTGDTIPKVLNSSVTPEEIFSPFKGERLEVRYDLNAPALVTVHYNDSAIVTDEPRQVLGNLEIWDGRDVNTGAIVVADNLVPIKIYTEPLPENVIAIEQKITLDVSELRTDPYVIRPLNNEVTKIVYTINEAADVTVKILTQDGSGILALLEDYVQKEAGTYILQWDGRTDAGETIVEEEDYRVRVEAMDSFGEMTIRDGNIRVMY